MQDNLNISNNLTKKLAEKLMCLEENLFSRMISNIKILEESKPNETKVEKLNRKLKKGRSLL